jgi:hypothetical protein
MPIFCGYAVLRTHGLTGKNVTVSIGMSIFKSSEINWFLGFLPKGVKSALLSIPAQLSSTNGV